MRRLLVLIVAVLAGCSSNDREAPDAAAPEVERAADLPTPRTEVAGATFGDGDTLIVAGGMTADGQPSDLAHTYDPATDEWTEAPRLPVAVHHAALVNARGRAYLIGGFTATGESPGVWSLGPGEDAWRGEPELPEPRGALAATAVGGTIVAFGGVSGGQVVASTVVLRDGTWERGPDLAEPREHLAATTVDGRAYAIAGRVGSLESNKRTVESWDPSGREGAWRRERGQLTDTRGGTAASGRCVAGGEEPTGTIATVECLQDDGDWKVVATLDEPRHGVAAIAAAGTLHVIAGGDAPGLFVTGTHETVDL